MNISLNRMVIYKYQRQIRLDYVMGYYEKVLDYIRRLSE
jgi:hypothetical protein